MPIATFVLVCLPALNMPFQLKKVLRILREVVANAACVRLVVLIGVLLPRFAEKSKAHNKA
ncbi:hypothetical protein LuPra_03359 [Luteitalea pratensis]|uniref:Uncharacterized protein n=1 Tax=Luteitalea pratensis TaxID=1855912 RepID=A0A143PNV8_LUTPR|nr:hypothetical protein LuPra_03359 [Luteitalea pratensis]